ncbi:MAG: tetratricopeptide repeat protein [Acidobacteriota bacterium]|nr:tetratricopeptide repeat protein [Acidobacteriota bacterium]
MQNLPEREENTGAGVRTYMAFGFGFNKQKVLSAAEKHVQQGKLPNAISEYEKVLKADPKDLTVMNTVGDLYARLGQNDKAIECFKNVGDAYAGQGFTVKAIAMYKKLAKIRPSLEGSLRLAELYTQQGLFNDSRAQYLQVAEEFLRSGELEQAVRIFQKTLEMDPENVAMRKRLAEVYVRLGKKTEAWQIFIAAAESLRAKGQLAPAEEILQRMLTLDPGNGYVLLLRGRTALDSGDLPAAIENLEKVSDLDSHPDGLRALFQAYLQSGRLPEAGTLAAKLLAVHNDPAPLKSYASALISAGHYEDGLRVYQQHADSLLSADTEKILESLHSVIGHVRDNPVALEILIELFNKAGESTHNAEVYELLAHAHAAAGDLEKSRQYYLKLTQLEPQNQLHASNYQQLMNKLSDTSARLITPEEGSVLVEELEATAPFVEQRYRDDLALELRAALTDAELFISYNMPEKGLVPLLAALPQAPRDLRLNQRLAALHSRAGRFEEAGVCCRTLESIYHDAGHPDEASRYGELAQKYEDRVVAASINFAPTAGVEAGVAELAPTHGIAEFQVSEFQVADAEAETEATSPSQASPTTPASGLFFHTPAAEVPESTQTPASEFEIHTESRQDSEIDLSAEWEESTGERGSTPTAEPTLADNEAVAEMAGEIRFYLAHGMNEQAATTYAKLEQLNPNASVLAALREEIAAGQVVPPVEEPEVVEETSPEAAEIPQIEDAEPVATVPAFEDVEPQSVHESTTESLDEFVADLEASVGTGFLPEAAADQHAPAELVMEAPAPVEANAAEIVAEAPVETVGEPIQTAEAAVEAAPETLGGFVADLEASLGDSFPAADQVAAHQIPAKQAPVDQVLAESKAPEIGIGASAAAGTYSAMHITSAPPASHSTIAASSNVSVPNVSAPAAAQAGIDLADMFGELKQELEDGATADEEDPETHYNLGVAFREMGLLDEAVGELQKVCQSIERGHKFGQVIQTYTWLAQCFLDKGVPDAAIRWYEKALAIPKLDDEARTALYYELAACYESAGNKKAALANFMQVYGSNIDYRDVAERITALKS